MASLHTAPAAQHHIVQILCSGCLWSEGLILLCLGVVAECYWTPLLWLCLHPSSSRKWELFKRLSSPHCDFWQGNILSQIPFHSEWSRFLSVYSDQALLLCHTSDPTLAISGQRVSHRKPCLNHACVLLSLGGTCTSIFFLIYWLLFKVKFGPAIFHQLIKTVFGAICSVCFQR